ncbi:MAG: CARDB domain-containing protein, partial [Thermoplasmata archaeon]
MKRANLLRENERGISEVVATLLVLVITVTLFSSIFAWINAMPPPMSKTYTEFSAKLETAYVAGNYSFYVNITHAGGEILYAQATAIIINLENFSQSFTLRLSDGDKDGTLTDGKWEPGEVWRWNSTPIYPDTSTVIVQIIDKVKNLLVWSSILYPQITDVPPAIFERGTTPDPVSTGTSFKVWAVVKDDDLNFDSVYVNLSALGIATPVKMNQTFGWRFETSNITCNAQAGKYLALINATDTKGHVSTATLSITVSAVAQEEAQPPKLIVERILLSNFSPTRGDTVTITAIIKNLNSMPAVSSNVSFWDYIPLTDTWSYIGWVNVSVAGYGQSQAYMYWTATPGGLHKIFVNITSVMPGNSNGIGANISIVVTPKILLVDDDGAVMGSGSNLDVASYMAAALDAANLNYRIYSVPFGLDGPRYDTGPVETQMQYYDVVIWVGGATNNSLTSNDTAELIKFLSGTSKVPAGKLWLVGENILEGVSTTFMNYIGINGILPPIPLPAQIYGQNPGVGWINLSNCQPLMDSSTFPIVRPINPLPSLNVRAVFMNGSATQYYGVQYRNTIGGREYKVVTFTFEFAAMRDMGDQAITAYKVVNWLSGLGNRTGEDLAVASQYIEPTNPRYMQPVNISATVRNNGASVQANVEVVAYIYVNGALLDTVTPVNTSITLEPDGGSQLVSFTWVPRMVGTYVIRVVVDPNNKVAETNEENNALSTAVGIHEINVLYTLLLVDDDSSAENGGGGTLPNVAQYVIDALTSLGYVNGTDMDIQKVPKGADRNNTEYNVSNYNCVLWVTGFASNSSGYNTLTSLDMQIIRDLYLPSDPAQHTFILIGREVLGDSGVANTAFMTRVMGAATAGTKYTDGVGKVVYGVRESPVTNGMRVEYTNGTSFPCYAYTKTASAIPLFWANGTTYWERTTDLVLGTGVKDLSGWHSAFLSFDLSYTTNFSLVKEILFNLIHWGGRVDALPELRVTPPDIYAATNSRPYIILPELNPQIGASYILKANITNVGGLSGDVIVRFLDGDTIINSVNIHVPESYADASNNVYNGRCVAEIIWTPLYAGYERISAVIDPDNLYAGSEKLRENNIASQQIQVFFFYDDMEVPERTAENWNHDATLLNINGESPLDFLARKDVSTRVIGDWDWNLSGCRDFSGVTTYNGNGTYLTNNAAVLNYTGGAAHTTPTAYWLPEVPMMEAGQKKPIDLIIVFDVSGSMNWDNPPRLTAAKAAAKAAVGMLESNDRIAIITFSSGVSRYIPFTYTTPANKTTINNSIDSITASGATSLFDASSYATYYMDTEGRPDAVKGIIFLTDGVSNDDDYTISTSIFYRYAPGGGGGYEPDEPGPVQFYTNGNGLCNMPYDVFTVSIGTTPDARMHAIPLTSPRNISYG